MSEEVTGTNFFLVYVVWRDNGSKKWFPVASKEGPSWPATTSERARFRFGVRSVDLQFNEGEATVRFRENIEDGCNVRKNYRMVKYEELRSYDFKIDY